MFKERIIFLNMVAKVHRNDPLEKIECLEKSALIKNFCSNSFVYIDEPLMMQIDSAGTKTKFYFGQTTNYNTEVVFDESGEVVERYEIEPFGEFKIYDGMTTTELTTSKVVNEYVINRIRYDEESGLCYFRNRYYSPKMERFISRDPLRFTGRTDPINLYRFVENNPYDGVDPFGFLYGDAGWDLGITIEDCDECEIKDSKYKRKISIEGKVSAQAGIGFGARSEFLNFGFQGQIKGPIWGKVGVSGNWSGTCSTRLEKKICAVGEAKFGLEGHLSSNKKGFGSGWSSVIGELEACLIFKENGVYAKIETKKGNDSAFLSGSFIANLAWEIVGSPGTTDVRFPETLIYSY